MSHQLAYQAGLAHIEDLRRDSDRRRLCAQPARTQSGARFRRLRLRSVRAPFRATRERFA